MDMGTAAKGTRRQSGMRHHPGSERLLVDFTEAAGNYLVLAKVPADLPLRYYAGSGWDRSGDFSNVGEWEAYLQQFAARLRSPLKISISPE